MENLKFRIWNPSGKNMLYDIDNVFECLKQQIKFDKAMPDRGFVTAYDHRSEGMVWMQYVGKKACQGIEIYEGDIVKVLYNQNSENYAGNNFNHTEHICIVEFSDYSSGFVLRNITEKYKGKHNFTTIKFDHRRLYGDRIQVIGNIYSNPELLK